MEHNRLIDDVAWAILQALHTNIPEDDRPMSWSDCSEEQQIRLTTAAQAAIKACLDGFARQRLQRPTIEELDAILNSKEVGPVVILPNGEVTTLNV